MAFSGSSYFAGVGTVFAAIGIGFACGMMITGNVVQPPNRLERVSAGAAMPSKPDAAPTSTASSIPEQASPAMPAAQETAPSPAVAAAASAPAANSQPAPLPQPPASATVKTDATTNAQEQPAAAARNSAPASSTKSEDATPTRNEGTVGRATDRSAGSNRESSRRRKSSDDRKFSEHRRRQDQDERRPDEATNTVRQWPRGGAIDEINGQDDTPRLGMRPRHFESFEDDDSPRVTHRPPPLFGFFGN